MPTAPTVRSRRLQAAVDIAWRKLLNYSRLTPLIEFWERLMRHIDGVCAWAPLRLTNAALEGNNARVRGISQRAHGYRNPDSLSCILEVARRGVTRMREERNMPDARANPRHRASLVRRWRAVAAARRIVDDYAMATKAKEVHEREAAEAVVRSFPEVSIDKMRDAPDVDLLHADGSHIGLEIVRMADERQLTLRQRLVAVTTRIQVELAARRIQGLYTIYYDIQAMFDDADKKAWDRKVPKAIVDFFGVRRRGQVNTSELVENGIECIAHIDVADAPDAPHTFVGCGWAVSTTPGNSLAEIALASKQQKLAGYRANADNGHFSRYWLAMASLGPGTMVDDGYMMLLERRFRTDYDRVLLLNHGGNGRLIGAQDVTPIR